MKILLIGNSGYDAKLKDGQTTKLRLYKKKIEDEGFEVLFVDLEHFRRHPLSILYSIKELIKLCDRIVLVSGERACKLLIPFINKHNRKEHKPFILPLVGIGVLHFAIDYLSDEEKQRFFINKEYQLGKVDNKLIKELNKIDYILPETELLNETYSNFYNLNNCFVLTNFRESGQAKNNKSSDKTLRLVYLSRIIEIKGILDLLKCLTGLESNFELHIYGENNLSESQNETFKSSLSNEIKYCGSIDSDKAIDTLADYDVLVFPTRYLGEGTPGAIVESLIAGTPVLTSSFPQAKYLLEDGYDSIFFEMFNKEDLKNKLVYCVNHKEELYNMRKNALKSGEKYLYQHERDKFLKYVCGVEEK